MARVDYEAAWTELQAYAASKTSHGQTDLLVRMAELADEHRVPEDLLEKAGRLLGGPIHVHTAEGHPSSTEDSDSRSNGESPPPTDDQGGHDGGKQSRRRGGEPVHA